MIETFRGFFVRFLGIIVMVVVNFFVNCVLKLLKMSKEVLSKDIGFVF